MARLRAGEPQAFAELYAALHLPLYTFLARLVGDRDDAADLVHDVFLAAFQQVPRHRGELRLEPWLYRVAMNKAFDLLRRRQARTTVPLDEAQVAAAADPTLASETAAAVEAALSRLSPRYRAALLLREVEGLDNRELATAMGVSAATAAVLLHRARAAFRRAYREVAQTPAAVAPATLALTLLPAIPAPPSLSTPPDFSALAAGAAGAAAGAAATAAGAAAGGGAPATGVLAKVAGLASTKVAVVAAAAVVATGGGLAARDLARHDVSPAQGEHAVAAARSATPAQGGGTAGPGDSGAGERDHRAVLAAARKRTAEGDGTGDLTGRSQAGQDTGQADTRAGDGSGSGPGDGAMYGGSTGGGTGDASGSGGESARHGEADGGSGGTGDGARRTDGPGSVGDGGAGPVSAR